MAPIFPVGLGDGIGQLEWVVSGCTGLVNHVSFNQQDVIGPWLVSLYETQAGGRSEVRYVVVGNHRVYGVPAPVVPDNIQVV